MPDVTQKWIVIDTLGKLLEHGFRLFTSCSDCAAAYRRDLPPTVQQQSDFDIDLPALIAERGPDSPAVRMAPLPCPRCGGKRTQVYVVAPPMRGIS